MTASPVHGNIKLFCNGLAIDDHSFNNYRKYYIRTLKFIYLVIITRLSVQV